MYKVWGEEELGWEGGYESLEGKEEGRRREGVDGVKREGRER